MKKRGGFREKLFPKIRDNAGFTVAELLVVMALIAVLSSLGGYFLQDAYNSYLADEGAQEILNAIRDAQNRSIAVKDGKKVWAAYVSAKPINSTEPEAGIVKIISYKEVLLDPADLDSRALEADPAIESRQIKATSVTLIPRSGSIPPTSLYPPSEKDHFVFAFSAPFGRPSFYRGSSDGALKNDCTDTAGTTGCEWKVGTGFLGDWVLNPEPDSDYVIIGDKTEEIQIKVVYGNQTRTVTMRSNGDASTN